MSKKSHESYVYRLLLLSTIFIISAGTLLFHLIEGWPIIDSYYFSVITLSTVGYGDLYPTTALGKFMTTVFIFIGVSIIAAFIQSFLRRQGRKIAEDASRRLPDVHLKHRK